MNNNLDLFQIEPFYVCNMNVSRDDERPENNLIKLLKLYIIFFILFLWHFHDQEEMQQKILLMYPGGHKLDDLNHNSTRIFHENRNFHQVICKKF